MNILPTGLSMLHMMALCKEAAITHINYVAAELFEVDKKATKNYLFNVDYPVKFELPILRDLKLRTPLDISLNVKTEKKRPPCSEVLKRVLSLPFLCCKGLECDLPCREEKN